MSGQTLEAVSPSRVPGSPDERLERLRAAERSRHPQRWLSEEDALIRAERNRARLSLLATALLELAEQVERREAKRRARNPPPPPSWALFGRGAKPDAGSRAAAASVDARSKTRKPSASAARQAARRLGIGAGLVSLSVFATPGYPRLRDMTRTKAMWAPMAAAGLGTVAGFGGLLDRGRRLAPGRDAAFGLAAATGLAGLALRLRGRRPSDPAALALLRAAPPRAAASVAAAGVLGLVAERLRRAVPGRPLLWAGSVGRMLAALCAALIGTSLGAARRIELPDWAGEKLRGDMRLIPLAVPALGAALLARAAVVPAAPRHPGRKAPSRMALRLWLAASALLGVYAAGRQAWETQRRMGGWRAWAERFTQSPPLPMPPALTGFAVAGIGALRMIVIGANQPPAAEVIAASRPAQRVRQAARAGRDAQARLQTRAKVLQDQVWQAARSAAPAVGQAADVARGYVGRAEQAADAAHRYVGRKVPSKRSWWA